MSLTAEQKAHREGRLTASRVAVLMTGSIEGIALLYREMIGEVPEENLSNVWPVQLGAATEQLNLDWYEMKNRRPVIRRGEVVVHRAFDWAAATLDGYDPELNCPIECKLVGGFEPMEIIIDRYQPQMQWQMECLGATQCAMSVIVGAKEPVVDYIPRDEAYAAEMVRRGAKFMMAVDMRQMPVHWVPPQPPPADPKVVRNMTGNNSWAARADVFLRTYQAAKDNDEAKAKLKAMVQPDDKKVFGHGVTITRDRALRLHVRPD